MTYEYFSDKELGSRELSSEEISAEVWNGIVAVYGSFILKNALAGCYPEECPDGQGISGCNKAQLENAIKAEIPGIAIPIRSHSKSGFAFKNDEFHLPDKYSILDFLEKIYRNIKDPTTIGRYHEFYNHAHYSFSDTGVFKSRFRERINTIFGRNGIVFFIDESGQIKRSIPKSIAKIITDIRFSTGDSRLNELLEMAYSKFLLPRTDRRFESLEKIWDAFERLKTYFEENKKNSASTLIKVVAENNPLFSEHIESEFKELTTIGNKFQIRHFERDKVQLQSNLHIDYLFYRMSCLIHLCVESLKYGQL